MAKTRIHTNFKAMQRMIDNPPAEIAPIKDWCIYEEEIVVGFEDGSSIWYGADSASICTAKEPCAFYPYHYGSKPLKIAYDELQNEDEYID